MNNASIVVKTLTLFFFVGVITCFVYYKSGAMDTDPNDLSQFIFASNTTSSDTSKKPILISPSKSMLIDEQILRDPLVGSGLMDSIKMIRFLTRYKADSIKAQRPALLLMSSSKSMPIISPEDRILLDRYNVLNDSVSRFRLLLLKRNGSLRKQ